MASMSLSRPIKPGTDTNPISLTLPSASLLCLVDLYTIAHDGAGICWEISIADVTGFGTVASMRASRLSS